MPVASRTLYMLRHAHAGNPEKWTGPDHERPLSERGRAQAERVAQLLRRLDARPARILASPRVRALQTAEPVAAALGLQVEVAAWLAAPFRAVDLVGLYPAEGDDPAPMIVGHDPDFSDVLSELVGAEVGMAKGSLARLDLVAAPGPGAGRLRWLLPPDALGSR